MSSLVLVLDQGGHHSRALVFDEAGRVVAQARLPVNTTVKESGTVEQDPVEIVDSLQRVIQDIAVQLGMRCRAIKSAALIVQRSSLLAWDSVSRQAISPVLSWQDTRNGAWLDDVVRDHRASIRESTGLFPNAHYGVSKMHWLLQNVAAVKAAYNNNALFLLPLASFLHLQLTNARMPVVDAVIASRTLLVESAARNWSSQLLEFFGIPLQVLPEIKPTMADYGAVSVDGFDVPLQLLGGDQSFFSLSYGPDFDANAIFINAGTGAFIQQRMAAHLVPERLLCSALSVSGKPEQTIVVAEGTVNSAASALDWLWERVGYVFSRDDWALAMQQADSAAVPYFINRTTAMGSPDWLPAGHSFFSMPASSLLEAIAVLESIVFSLQRNMDCLMAVQLSNNIVLSGGLAQLEVFCQCLADLAGQPVWCSDEVEACARGAAMQLLPSMTYRQKYRHYAPHVRPFLQRRYQEWTAAMNQLSCSG